MHSGGGVLSCSYCRIREFPLRRESSSARWKSPEFVYFCVKSPKPVTNEEKTVNSKDSFADSEKDKPQEDQKVASEPPKWLEIGNNVSLKVSLLENMGEKSQNPSHSL